MPNDWLREEEKLLELVSNNTFHLIPLETIAVSFVYINHNREVVHIKQTQFALITTGALESTKSILPWSPFQTHIHSNSKWKDTSYVMEDAVLHHIPILYGSIDAFNPANTFQTINADCKIEPALALFHDLSEIFVFMREKPPSSTKSILKTGGTGGKTKKVRIAEKENEIITYSIRSNKRLTRKSKHKCD